MAKDETQQIIASILDFLHKNPDGHHTSEIAKYIGRNRITTGKYLDILQAQGKVKIRRIGQAKVYEPNGLAKKPKILIVDDEPHVLELIALTLQEQNYDIHKAEDGEQALASVRIDMPDVIVLDLMMPKVDGFEVCKQVKNNTLTKHIPIIILSAKSQTEDKIKGMKLGADEFLTKPFDPLELEARIDALIQKQQAQKMLNSISGFPDEQKTQLQLSGAKKQKKLYISITHLDEYFVACGHHQGRQNLSLLFKLIAQVLRDQDISSFIGHANDTTLVVLGKNLEKIKTALNQRFHDIIPYLYPGLNIENNKLITSDGKVPLINLTCSIKP